MGRTSRRALAALGLRTRSYFLFAGGISPHKNLETLLDAYSKLREARDAVPPLVLVGDLDDESYLSAADRVRRRIATLELAEHVRLPGFVSDETLACLYSGATCVVLPSLAEGFGLPAVEAAACGAPLVLSDLPAHRETLDGAALFVRPTDVDGFAAALGRVLDDESERDVLARRAQEAVAHLSWDAAADTVRAASRRRCRREAARMSERPLSFCMVTTFYPPYHFGGEAMYLYHLTNELALRGHEVTVVHCVDSFNVLTSEPPRGDFPQPSNVTVERLHSPLGPLSPVVTYVAGTPGLKARQLKRILTPGRFDVVHFHLVTLVGGPGILRYGDGVKLYTTHDHWLVCPMYDLWRYNRELCDRRECLRCTLSFRRPPQLWRYTRWQRHLANVDLFLSPSRSTIEQHRARGFPYPMQHLPYFLPPAIRPIRLALRRIVLARTSCSSDGWSSSRASRR